MMDWSSELFGFISLSFLICTNTTGEIEVPSSQCAQDTMYVQLWTCQGWTNKEQSGTQPPCLPLAHSGAETIHQEQPA